MMPATPLPRLPDQLSAFAISFAECGDQKAAAISVGVHPQRAARFAREALGNPAVKAAVDHCVRTRFAEAGPLALNVLIRFARNEHDTFCSRELQLSAAKSLADRAGFNAKDMRDADKETKDLAEMSPEELRHVLESTEAELGNRAKLVDVAPDVGAGDAQAVDLEG